MVGHGWPKSTLRWYSHSFSTRHPYNFAMTVLRIGFTSSIRYVSTMERHSTLRSRYYGCGHLLLIDALSLVDDIDG